MSEIEWKRSACPYDCPDACGLLMETDGETVFRVKGDKSHPVTCGFICRKMQHYEQTIHHPERILTPLKRTGAKGSGQFEPISWKEAVEEITMRWKEIIEKYGSEAILPYSFSGTEHMIQNKCGEAFFNRLGASKLERTICSPAKTEGFEQIIGRTRGINPDELQYSDLIILWGCNVNAISVHLHAKILEAKKRGAKVILIETYKTPAAKLASETLLLVPGTDGALALSMANIIKKQGLLHKKFLKKHTTGYRRFLNSLTGYTAKWASDLTGIAEEKILKLATDYGRAKTPVIVFGSGLSRHGNGAMTTRCIAALPALTGAYGKMGGGIWGNISAGIAFDEDIIKRPDFCPKPVRNINMNQIGSALLGYDFYDSPNRQQLDPPVQSIYVYNSNPVDVAPDQKKVIKGFTREDLFTVVHERFMTDTAKFADIILPADTSAEHPDLVIPYGHFTIQKIDSVIKPLGECRSNWDTFCTLAQAMGFEDDYFKLSNEEICCLVAEKENDIRSQWNADEAKQFQEGIGVALKLPSKPDIGTNDGKIHFYDPSLKYPLPTYVPNYGGKYPLKLIAAPSIDTLNSTFNERPDLVDQRGRAVLKINPLDAYARNIADGNIIKAFNDLAEIEIFAEVTMDVPQGTVIAEGVYKLEQSLNELTFNALMSERLTDYGRASTLCDNTIDLEKI